MPGPTRGTDRQTHTHTHIHGQTPPNTISDSHSIAATQIIQAYYYTPRSTKSRSLYMFTITFQSVEQFELEKVAIVCICHVAVV